MCAWGSSSGRAWAIASVCSWKTAARRAASLDQRDVRVLLGLIEARPAGTGLELRVRAEQLGAAARAAVDAVLLVVHVAAREWRLGALASQHLVLLRCQLLAPLLVGLIDLRCH